MSHIRYAVAACQTDLPNPLDRRDMRGNTDRMLAMIDHAVAGSRPFLPVRLIVFPEFAHSAPVFADAVELADKLAVPIPNEHTDRLERKAREHDVYIQSGSMIEQDPAWPGVVFNATCLVGPGGILYRYRKVNPWIPYEVHASPHDLPGYDEELFPVADTLTNSAWVAITVAYVAVWGIARRQHKSWLLGLPFAAIVSAYGVKRLLAWRRGVSFAAGLRRLARSPRP